MWCGVGAMNVKRNPDVTLFYFIMVQWRGRSDVWDGHNARVAMEED